MDNFGEVCEYIASNLAGDGDSTRDIPATGPYFSSLFGKRVALALRSFTKLTYGLYSPSSALSLEADDWTVNLNDPAKSAVSFFEVRELWIDGRHIEKSPGRMFDDMNHAPAAGRPTYWGQLDAERILFSCPLGSDPGSAFECGFYRHPYPISDTSIVLLGDELEAFDRFAQAQLRQDVAASELTLARLQRIDGQAAASIREIKAANLARFLRL